MSEEIENGNYPGVRIVTRADRKKLSKLIQKYVKKSGDNELISMIPGMPKKEKEQPEEANEDQIYELINKVFSSMLEFIEEDFTGWLMDVANIQSVEEFDKMPFDVDTYIIEELLKQKGFRNFFMRASELFKRIRGLIK